MKRKTFLAVLLSLIFTLGFSGISYSVHVEEKGVVKGTVTEIKVTEVELTVKDDKGKETKIKTKDPAAFKQGDRVVIKGGKVAKEVKPITGGY